MGLEETTQPASVCSFCDSSQVLRSQFWAIWFRSRVSRCSYLSSPASLYKDTGAAHAIYTAVQPPNGISYFGSTSGRASDGRLIIDFITEELKLPYLSAYLNSIGSNYRHGANFAVGGASIRPGGYSPIFLGLQVSQFILFKSHTKILFNQFSDNRTEPPFKSGLPRNEEFSKALYTIDIGENQDPVVRPISELGPLALQELMPEIPLWVKTPDYERVSFINICMFHQVDWLNKFLFDVAFLGEGNLRDN